MPLKGDNWVLGAQNQCDLLSPTSKLNWFFPKLLLWSQLLKLAKIKIFNSSFWHFLHGFDRNTLRDSKWWLLMTSWLDSNHDSSPCNQLHSILDVSPHPRCRTINVDESACQGSHARGMKALMTIVALESSLGSAAKCDATDHNFCISSVFCISCFDATIFLFQQLESWLDNQSQELWPIYQPMRFLS
jgi:hypothetical protein